MTATLTPSQLTNGTYTGTVLKGYFHPDKYPDERFPLLSFDAGKCLNKQRVKAVLFVYKVPCNGKLGYVQPGQIQRIRDE